MAPFWGPILSVWSSYSRNPDIMTTDKTTTVWLCLGVNTGSSRLNGLKTHMEMAWIPKRGVPWLKSHSDRPIHRPFCHILTIPSPPTDQHQQNQWEESCKSPPNHHHRPRLVPGRWPGVSAPLPLLEHRDLQEWSLFTSLAPRCSPKQSWRLKQEQRAGKGDSNLIAYYYQSK